METPKQPDHFEKELDIPVTDELFDQIDNAFYDETGQQDKIATEQPEKAQAAPEPDRSGEQGEIEEVAEIAADEPVEAKIDYKMEIPMPDGRDALTLGELKDKVVELDRTEQQLIDRENAVMRERDELASVLSQVGEIPPDVQQKMAKHQEMHLQREHDAMLAAIPEMAEKTGFDKVKTAVTEVMTEYGAAEDIGKITDHRLIKMAYDLHRLKAEKAAAQETAKQVRKASKPKGVRPRAKTSKSDLEQQLNSAMQGNNEDAKYDAIEQLLRSN